MMISKKRGFLLCPKITLWVFFSPSRLMHLWQTLYECHRAQNHISLQLNHLAYQQNAEFSSEYHRQVAAQLKTEVTSWHNSFCKLIKYQQEYVRALCKWTELANCLRDIDRRGNSSMVHAHALAEEWLLALDKLPDKVPLFVFFNFIFPWRSSKFSLA